MNLSARELTQRSCRQDDLAQLGRSPLDRQRAHTEAIGIRGSESDFLLGKLPQNPRQDLPALVAGLGAVFAGVMAFMVVRTEDATARPDGLELIGAVLWRGVVYGVADGLLLSVGCYRIEGRGIQLFSRVDGDHFTIIGLPLLPLLGYLREIGWLRS